MNKPYLFLILLLCLVCEAMAQSQTRDSIITRQRVVRTEQTNYVNDTAVRYSIVLRYKYSGKRGSVFHALDPQPWIGYGYLRFRNSWEEAEFAHLPEPFYDAYRADVLYDTVYDQQFQGKDTSGLMVKYRKYDDTVLRISSDILSASAFTEREIIRDKEGKPQKIHYYVLQNNMPGARTLYFVDLKYDARGYIKTDTMFRPDYTDTFARTYEHDEEGRVISVLQTARPKGKPWQDVSWHKYEYNSIGGKVTLRLELEKDSSNKWDTAIIRQLQYDSDDILRTFRTISFRTNSPDTDLVLYHYDTAGNMDTMMQIQSFGTTYRHAYHYNTFGNPDTSWLHTLHLNGVYTKTSRNVDSYEEYNDTLKIDIPASNKPLILYPNPAGSKVTIRWNKAHPHQPVNIFLYNVAGQLVRKYNLQTLSTEDSIDISGLASGVYVLGIRTLGGGNIHTQLLTIRGW